MTTVEKALSFVEEAVALIKGDSAEATAIKIQRLANSALDVQIAVNHGKTVVFEDAVEASKEKLHFAKLNNGVVITDGDNYVEQLIIAKNNLTIAEENLVAHLETIDFLIEQSKKIGKAAKPERE